MRPTPLRLHSVIGTMQQAWIPKSSPYVAHPKVRNSSVATASFTRPAMTAGVIVQYFQASKLKERAGAAPGSVVDLVSARKEVKKVIK